MREVTWEPFPESPKARKLHITIRNSGSHKKKKKPEIQKPRCGAKCQIANRAGCNVRGSLCSLLMYLNSSNLNAKSGDYCSLSPGNQPAIFLRSHWYTSFEESLTSWSWGETYWTMHKELAYSAPHRTDQFPLNIARFHVKLGPFLAVCARMVITLRSTSSRVQTCSCVGCRVPCGQLEVKLQFCSLLCS